jgi:hypothetical protein
MSDQIVASTLYCLISFFEGDRYKLFVNASYSPKLGGVPSSAVTKLFKDYNFQQTQGLPKTPEIIAMRETGVVFHAIPMEVAAKAWTVELQNIIDLYFSDVKVSNAERKFVVSRGQSLSDAVFKNFSYSTMRGCYRVIRDKTPAWSDPHFYALNMLDAFGTLNECLDTIVNGSGHEGFDNLIANISSSDDFYLNGYPNDLLGIAKRNIATEGLKSFTVHSENKYCSCSIDADGNNPREYPISYFVSPTSYRVVNKGVKAA